VQKLFSIVLALLPLLVAASAFPASPTNTIAIYPDGSLTLPALPFGTGPGPRPPGNVRGEPPPLLRWHFGLPRVWPERRWLEDESVPLFHTAWVSNGIRYTQKVLVTSLGATDLALAPAVAPETVVLVQINGLNTNSEYTLAQAAVSVELAGRPLDLHLREGLVFATGKAGPARLLAALDIPGEGIAATNGLQLRFQGNMPPGTSGAMTVKIPLGPLADQKTISRLQDLDFEEEVRRVKQAWKNAGRAAAPRWPIAWMENP
jgi:hypothetical protein